MQFYPHQLSTTSVGTAVSSSIARTGSLIANFSAISVTTISTASLALNISGAKGTDGTGASVTGPKGATGPRGVTGFRGNSVFLLSGSWNIGSCASPISCYPYQFGNVILSEGQYICDFGSLATYYSSDPSAMQTGTSPMYYNSTCTSPVTSVSIIGAYGIDNTVYGTNASATASFVSTCNSNV